MTRPEDDDLTIGATAAPTRASVRLGDRTRLPRRASRLAP